MYYQHFGLHGSPFNFTPPDRLFLSAGHREGLAALKWGFQEEPSGLTLLVGEAGTGKTTLIHSLLARQTARVRIASVTNPTATFEQMLQFIVQEIGIHPIGKGKLAILQALKTFLMDPESDRVVLIFDEAQGLSDEILEELRLLSNSRPNTCQSLQIVLVGQPELTERLSAPKLRALNQRIGARAMLHPLRGTEIYDYVEHLLHEQGGQLKIFSRGALDWLVRLSGGIPRRINVICHNSLLLAYLEGSVIVKSRHVRAAAAEYDDVVASSAKRRFRTSEAARLALHWLSGRGLPAVAVSILAIAALGAVFAFGVDPARVRRLVASESMNGGRPQPQPSSPKLSRAFENSLPVAAIGAPPSKNPGRQPAVPQKAALLAHRPTISPPKAATVKANAAQISAPNAPTKNPETSGEALPPLVLTPVEERTTASAPERVPNNHVRNTIRYDINRAEAALRDGRYNNAIWHLERAIALDPDNQILRDRLSSARRASGAARDRRYH
jgi:type II secretory pathway predicted ATPase ExeA